VRRARFARFAAGAVSVLVLSSCSGSDDGGSSSSPAVDSLVTSACAPGDPVLVIDEIPDAVAAVEAELGGPQRYFEINATTVLVNLFVASPDGTQVTPYVYSKGTLSSDASRPATGNSFPASVIDIDPQSVTSCISGQLPTSTQDLFLIQGGADDAVRYGVLVTSQAGGQLLVEVSGTGVVLGVDPVDG